MLSKEIEKKISLIKIKIRQALSGTMVGDYSTATKGSGLEFNQLHDYQENDDIRFVDWKSSARTSKMLVRQYLEERNRTIIIAVDISSSSFFSSTTHLKYEAISQVAAILALVSDYGKDNVGLLIFSDKVHEFVPPKRGHLHITILLHKLFSQKQTESGTNISEALFYIGMHVKRGSLVFMVSDFIEERSFEKQLLIVTKKISLVAVRCLDKQEQDIFIPAFVNFQDLESGDCIALDSSNNGLIQRYLQERIVSQDKIFKRCRVEILEIRHHQNYVVSIIKFFKKRMLY